MGLLGRIVQKRVEAKLLPLVNEMNAKAMAIAATQFIKIGSSFWGGGLEDPTSGDTLYTILRKRTMKEASIPLYVYKKKDRAALKKYLNITKGAQNSASFQKSQIYKIKALDEVAIENDFAKLLQNPNNIQGSDAFWQGVFWEYALGEAFIWKNRGGVANGKPVELLLLAKDQVEVVQKPNDQWSVSHYWYSAGSTKIRIDKEDMIHWKTFNPSDPLRGFNPLKALKKRLKQDDSLTDAAVYGASNNGSDGALFPEQLEAYSETQLSQINETIDSRVNNVKARKAISFLPSKFNYINFGRSADEMELLEQLGWTFERVCHAFGIPPVIFKTDSSFANQEWGQKNWITNDIMSVLFSLRDELNRSLAPDFGNDFISDPDFSSLPEMQDDMKKLMDGLTPLFDRGALSPNEMRAIGGFEQTTDPLHNLFYIQSGYTPLSDMQLQPDSATQTTGKDHGDYL